jgi:uncharacterized protein YecT (DUF1311 family)
LLILLPSFAAVAFAADKPLTEPHFIEVHGEHIKLVENTLSPDGHYAAGWTVAPKKGKPPVQWKEYSAENNNFIDDYLDNESYVVTDVIVDLKHNSIASRLQFKEPFYDRKGHGALEVLYGPEKDGHRYAIALSDSKWCALDVVLVDLGPDGSSQADIHKLLDGTALDYVRRKEKHMSGGYMCDYQLFSLPELGLRTGFADFSTVRVPFSATIPKESGYGGTILLRLSTKNGKPHAESGEVHESPEQVDPITDDPRIVTADKELNAVYTALRNKLDKAGKAKLVAEQRDWIKDRDTKVANLGLDGSGKLFIDNLRVGRDRLLLQLTKERTEELRAR